jgi:hypothetical protein
MFHGPIAAAGLLDAPVSSAGTLINFVDGSYVINGSSYAASDIVSDPSKIDASGLHAGDGGAVSIIGDLLTALTAANWTIVIEWQELYDTGVTMLIDVSDGSTQEFGITRDDVVGNILMEASEASDPSGYRETQDPASGSGPFGIGVHRVALTRTDTAFSMSADGRSVISDSSTPGTFSPTLAAFGGLADGSDWRNDCYIRRLEIYPPQADADLPSLSA